MKSWTFGAMVVSMFAVAAGCGAKGTSTGTTTGDSAGGSGGMGSGGMTTGSTTTTGSMATGTGTTSSSSTGGGDTCADASDCAACLPPSASDTTCAKCCDTVNPGAYDAFATTVTNSCACPDASACHAACGVNGMAPDFCADMTKIPSPACVMCIDNIMQGNACLKTFQMACQADTDCATFVGCLQGCKGKP